MDRLVDANQFVAEGAVVDWETAWAAQEKALAAANRPGRDHFAAPRGLQLRWYVSDGAGVPPVPFTVWVRQDKDALDRLDVFTLPDGDGTWIVWAGPPLLTLEITCTPVNAAKPRSLWAFRTEANVASAVAVTSAPAGPAQLSLTVRSGSITYARLVNGTLVGARAVRAATVASEGTWEELELVGLPYDAADWAGLEYDGPKQGMVAALVDPFAAAVERIKRAGPPFGWYPVTETGHLAPPWEPPDPGALVKDVQSLLLSQIGPLFAPGLDPAAQAALRQVHAIGPPEQDGRVATVASSTAKVPPLGSLLMAANTDPFEAIAVGFGTGYPLSAANERLFGRDLMVTATYPKGVAGLLPLEYAWIVPAQAPHSAMASPAGLTAGRAGLLDPLSRNQPWRDTVRLSWLAIPRSFLLSRAAGAAAARYDPPDLATPAQSLLDTRPSGGPQPLAPVRQVKPANDHVAVVDAARPLPVDGTARTSGYAVAQQDPFGVWSPWEDVAHSATEPDQPIPVISDVRLDASFAGTSVCPMTLSIVVTVDWSARSPAFLQTAVVVVPAPYSGAPTPAGVTPFGPPPAGGRRFELTVQFIGDTPNPLSPGLTVEPLSASDDVVVAPGPAQGERRRYRLLIANQTLDFTTEAHYLAATWAREAAFGRPSFGAVSPQPMRAFASSPVPVVVPAPGLPIVPLGSLTDAEGSSHVQLRLAVPEATKLVVWTATELRIRHLAGIGPIPPAMSLSLRFVALKQAFASLTAEQKREAFARVTELTSPLPATLDHPLPRGSREIHLFTVTGITPANVESAFPTNIDQFQAAAAPTPVRPGVPEISSAIVSQGGGDRVQVDLSCRSTVPVVAFELHRTYLPAATGSTGQMGPPLASVAATVAADPETPAGLRYIATFVDPSLGDWRPARYRTRAVPLLAPADREHGRVGQRSLDSSTSTVLLPPPDAPDLVLGTVTNWAPDETGVLVPITTDAPLERHPLGPFRLDVDAAVAGGGAEVAAFSTSLDQIAEASVTTPPGAVGTGTFTRTARVARHTTVAIWFSRPSAQQAIDVVVRLTDPLGRSREVTVTVPALPLHPVPQVAITGVRAVPNGVVATITTNVVADSGPGGDASITVTARRLTFPATGATVHAALAAIPDVDALPPNPPGQIVLAANRTHGVEYLALVRITRPFGLRVVVTDSLGRSATASRTVGLGPL